MKIFHLATETGTNARVPIGRTQGRIKPVTTTAAGEEVDTQSIHRGDVPGYSCANPENLIQGDPEIDMQRAGKILRGATRGFRFPNGVELVGDFHKMVTSYDAAGNEKGKAQLTRKNANVNENVPVRMKKRTKLKEAFSKFVFHNHYVLRHDDGVQFDFLQTIAKDLWDNQEIAALGTGAKGNGPLIFIEGGSGYKGYLYGECQGDKYKLLVLLTRMELKLPEKSEKPTATIAAD